MNSFFFQKYRKMGKIHAKRVGDITISRRQFLSQSFENFRKWTLWCFRSLFLVLKKSVHKRMYQVFIGMSFQSTDFFRSGTLLCFKINFGVNNFHAQEGWNSVFASRKFCLTVPKKFGGEPFGVSEIS